MQIPLVPPVLVLATATGCLAPPPQAAADAKAADATATPAAPAPAGGGTKTPPDLSKPLVLWNGDDVNPASRAWSDCDSKPCTSAVEPAAKVGANDSAGLEFRVDTQKGWTGFGWNFTSWNAGAAADATGRKTLKLRLKIVAETPDHAPALDAIQIGLRCAKAKECGRTLGGIAKYDPKAADGNWHELTLPLDDMLPEKGAIWDPGSVWEVTFSQWAPTPKKFVAVMDDIRFE